VALVKRPKVLDQPPDLLTEVRAFKPANLNKP